MILLFPGAEHAKHNWFYNAFVNFTGPGSRGLRLRTWWELGGTLVGPYGRFRQL